MEALREFNSKFQKGEAIDWLRGCGDKQYSEARDQLSDLINKELSKKTDPLKEFDDSLKDITAKIANLHKELEWLKIDKVDLQNEFRKIKKEARIPAINSWNSMLLAPEVGKGFSFFSDDIELLTVGGNILKGYFDFFKAKPTICIRVCGSNTSDNHSLNEFQGWREVE